MLNIRADSRDIKVQSRKDWEKIYWWILSFSLIGVRIFHVLLHSIITMENNDLLYALNVRKRILNFLYDK